VAWNFLLDGAAFRFRWIERIVEPRPLPLIRAGRILHRDLRAEFVTVDELHSHLRQNGVASASEVRRACLESDGNLSVLKYEKTPGDPPPRRPRRGPTT
jgi:uncharacterized membrane protein YcaP (DUF421 family)